MHKSANILDALPKSIQPLAKKMLTEVPKSTDLRVHTKEDLQTIARSLNDRPRKALGFMKPSEKLAEPLALTG